MTIEVPDKETAGNLIHLRSAARFGYWDMNKNRRRIEEIRRRFFEGHP